MGSAAGTSWSTDKRNSMQITISLKRCKQFILFFGSVNTIDTVLAISGIITWSVTRVVIACGLRLRFVCVLFLYELHKVIRMAGKLMDFVLCFARFVV